MNVKQGYKGNSGKLVSSELLYEQLKAYDDRRESKEHEKLYTTIPETQDAYIKVVDGSVSGALEVVDDTTPTPTSTQIKLSDVTPVRDASYTPSIGDFVVLELGVAEHEVTTYMPREETYTKAAVDEKITEIASGGLKPMTEPEFNTFWDGLTITASGYVDPSQP